MAIRDNPIAASAMGINTALYKTLTFGVSALYTGVAGALGAIVVQFVAPDSFNFLLSISFLVGLVIGGVGSIPGCLVGGLFVLFVPNIAESVSTGLAGVIYGVILLIVIFVMPAGTAGFARIVGALVALAAIVKPVTQITGTKETTMKRLTRRTILAAAPSILALASPFLTIGPARAAKKYDPGVTDTEIKIGNTGPYSGPASSYSAVPKAQAARLGENDQRRGRDQRTQRSTSSRPDDAYTPRPKPSSRYSKRLSRTNVLQARQPKLLTPTNSVTLYYMNQKKVPQLFMSLPAPPSWTTRRTTRGRSTRQPNYWSEEGADLQHLHPARKNRRPDPGSSTRCGRTSARTT